MLKIPIKSRFNGSLIFEAETKNLKACVELAVSKKINLGGADLGCANLGRAYLGGADLGCAYLGDAYLGGADLGCANLGGANLGCANLGRAYLGGANLGDAYLGGANLGGAYLGDADLGRAYLGGANLGGANLGGADLGSIKIEDLMCINNLKDAIDLAPTIFDFWDKNGLKATQKKFGMYKIHNENRALVLMCPLLIGGYCFVPKRREIWWWQWFCPNPETVPVLWKDCTK